MFLNRTARDRAHRSLPPHTPWGHIPLAGLLSSPGWRMEWTAGKRWLQAELGLTLDRMENEGRLHAAVPGFSIWISKTGAMRSIDKILDRLGAGQLEGREWRAFFYSIDGDVVCGWYLGTDPDSSSIGVPGWRRAYIDLKEALLGPRNTIVVEHERHQVQVHVPGEGGQTQAHPAEITTRSVIYGHKRLPRSLWKQVWQADVNLGGEGITVPGKGTTDYNCGPSAIQALTVALSGPHAIEEAIAATTKAVLRDRRRYPL
jgi:hypothetical protein